MKNKNAIKYGFSQKQYEEFPPVVQIAIVSGICPSACRYCPMGRKNKGELSPEFSTELPIEFFDFRLFCSVVDEMSFYDWSILRIHSRGEPMSHPQYDDMIAYAKTKKVTITSFTNGILLKDHYQKLVEAPIDMLEISADACDEEDYQAWRRNEHFSDVVEGVRNLYCARNAIPGSPTRIVVSAVDHPEFRSRRSDFEEYWSPYCDKVVIRPYHNYGGRIEKLNGPKSTTQPYIPCVQLWERFSISPTGLVNACFNDWGDINVVGNMTTSGASIKSIWRGGDFEEARKESLIGPHLQCCKTCTGPSLSSWGSDGYQHWVHKLLATPHRDSTQ